MAKKGFILKPYDPVARKLDEDWKRLSSSITIQPHQLHKTREESVKAISEYLAIRQLESVSNYAHAMKVRDRWQRWFGKKKHPC